MHLGGFGPEYIYMYPTFHISIITFDTDAELPIYNCCYCCVAVAVELLKQNISIPTPIENRKSEKDESCVWVWTRASSLHVLIGIARSALCSLPPSLSVPPPSPPPLSFSLSLLLSTLPSSPAINKSPHLVSCCCCSQLQLSRDTHLRLDKVAFGVGAVLVKMHRRCLKACHVESAG